jgi:DNA polymerase I-like protein with 3'-5' exonuclease and polymerase domains
MADLGYTPDMPLAVDIETPETDKINEEDSDDPEKTSYTIIRCGFSFRSGTAASYPWVEPYVTFTRRLLSMARVCVLWNGGFDSPRLSRANCPIKGKVIDGMWMFHFLQSDLPKSLEFVAPFYTDVAPWKHLSQAEPAFYNATDNDVTLRCYEAMREWLVRQGRWERFQRHCSDTAEILGEMSTAGVLIDVAARSALQDGLRAEIAVLDSTIQAAVPRELLPVKELKTERTLKELPDEERNDWQAVEVKCECKRMRKSTGRCLVCDGTRTVSHFRKLLPFNWNSTDQAQELAKHYGFTIPKKRGAPRDENGEQPDTLDAKVLKRFGKRKPIFLTILHARQHNKLITTYNWDLDNAGRVHTTFGFQPSNWRKSSKQPNLQNIPKRNDLAAAFRRTIIATPGHVLIEADSSAIEAVIVGYCAGSERYIKISRAGIHGFVSSHRLALRDGGHGIDPNLPFAELTKACKQIKRDFPAEYEDAKRGDHAVNYGFTAYGMNDEYPDTFPTINKGQEFIDFYFGLFNELPPWQRRTKEQADRQTFLDNHYQYRHYFYAVTKWNSKYQKFDLGPDAKRAVSFVPSSDASAIQTEDLLTFGAIPELRRMLRLIVHDSHIVECPVNDVSYVCPILYSTMSRPRPELGGLEIGVEIKVGENLCDTTTWEPVGRPA